MSSYELWAGARSSVVYQRRQKTDMAVLEQACKNQVTWAVGNIAPSERAYLLSSWPQWHTRMLQAFAAQVRAEYHRLMAEKVKA